LFKEPRALNVISISLSGSSLLSLLNFGGKTEVVDEEEEGEGGDKKDEEGRVCWGSKDELFGIYELEGVL